jgi:hypothetical protein
VNIPCKLCEKRRARRYCPGVREEICAVCCGTERENTIDCPLDCQHLAEARRREKPPAIAAGDLPNQDIRLSDKFVRENERAILWLTTALMEAMEKERAVDFDAREALDALIRTYRALESGLIFETRPVNPYAGAVQRALQQSVEELRKRLTEETGMHRLRDADVLGALVFLQRVELRNNNGRRRGRAFFDFLRGSFPAPSIASVEA